MVLKSLDDRVRDGFDADTLEKYGLRYFEGVMGNWRDSEATMRRTLTFDLVLVIIFFLLAHAKNAEVAFGPLKVTNVAAVLTLIPTLVAFLGHEWVELGSACERYEYVCERIVTRLAPSIRENDLDALLSPPTVHPMGRWADRSWGDLRHTRKPITTSILEGTRLIIGVTIIFGSLVFLAYAYRYLYDDSHANSVAVSVGVGITAVYALRSVTVMIQSTT